MKKFTLTLFVTLLAGIQMVSAQNIRVTGTVNDESGAPLAGVTVLVSGTQRGTTTSGDGSYSIQAPAGGELQFSFVGMIPVEVPVSNRNVINVTMQIDAETLEDVVVVAYGTQRKRDLTGSMSTIGSEALSLQTIATASKALDGMVAGVNVVSGSGQPGLDSKIYIRGVSSVNGKQDALVVVDGVPYPSGLSAINPNDIESMVVSKDAVSNSLYGSRAAAGVILVTTKKGQAGEKGRVTIDVKMGANYNAVPNVEVLGAKDYYEWGFKALYNYANANGYDDSRARQWAANTLLPAVGNYATYKVADGRTLIDPLTGKLDASAQKLYEEDWEGELTSPGFRQEYNVNATGTSGKTNYYISLGWLSDPSFMMNSSFERYTGRVNLDTQVNDWFRTGANFSYSRRDSNEPPYSEGGASSNNAFMYTKWMPSIYPIYARDEAGKIRLNPDGTQMYDLGTGQTLSPWGATSNSLLMGNSPISYYERDKFQSTLDNVSARMFGEIKFLKNFTLTANLALDNVYGNISSFQNNEYGIAADPSLNGYVGKEQYQTVSMNANQLLNYTNSFGRHNISAMAGNEYYYYNRRYMNAERLNIFVPGVPELDNAIDDSGASSYTINERLHSYFGSANYNFDEKYYFSAGIRRDGSSSFKNDIWGTFWSVGAAWRISSENWMASTSHWLDDLKLRASYGTTGNKEVYNTDGTRNYYPYTDTWKVVKSGSSIGITLDRAGNPDISWETKKEFDVGLDIMMFNNRLNVVLDYYRMVTDDMFWYLPTAASTGQTTRLENVGSLLNQGVEAEFSYNILRNKNTFWHVNLILAHSEATLNSLPGSYKNPYIDGAYMRGTGKPWYNLYYYKYAGVDPETGDALFTGLEATGDNPQMITVGYDKITTIQKTEIGDAMPDLTGGLNTSFRWKNFDVAVYTSFAIGGKIRFGDLVNTSYDGRMGFNVAADALNAWTPENRYTDVPKPYYSATLHTTASSDRFIYDASYFNLKSINVGYTLPAAWSKKMQLESVRIYFSADNVWFKSAKKGLDPRRGRTGVDGVTFGFPQYRSISGGLTVSF